MSVEIDPKLCFVLMPMKPDFIELYEDVIKPTVEEAGLNCLYAGEIFGAKLIMEDIWDRIERARVIIADLTGRNPNVFYEVGYGHSLDKGKVILLTQDIEDVPFDLRGFRHIVYKLGPRGLKELRTNLAKTIEAVLAEKPQSPRVVIIAPARDERTRQALEVYSTIEAIERGQPLMIDEWVTRLLKLPEKATILEATITIGDIEFILIPAGEFIMGSDEGLPGERPPHSVHVDAFYIGKYPITNGQYRRFVVATGHKAPRHWSKSHIPKGKENHPVVEITWYDAWAYCQWLTNRGEHVVRLPTEADWEKAARGTHGSEYPWGDTFDGRRCNTQESGVGDTTPVGRYSPEGDSPYGVADMAGNVWEWTSSLHEHYPYDPDDGREDLEAEGRRVVRGGSFTDTMSAARATYRGGAVRADFTEHAGFRVVVVPRCYSLEEGS